MPNGRRALHMVFVNVVVAAGACQHASMNIICEYNTHTIFVNEYIRTVCQEWV